VDETSTAGLAGSQEIELGLSNGLGKVLLGNVASGNALDGLDGLLSNLANGRASTADLDGQETSIRVSVVGGEGLGAGVGVDSLGEKAETRRPLDGGGATEKADKDSGLRGVAAKGSTGEGNDISVLAGLGNTLLATEVLGGGSIELALAGGRNILEEGLDPLSETGLAGAVSDNSDVGLGIGKLGESGDGVLVQVGRDGSLRSRVARGAEAVVEGDRMGGIEGDGGRVELGLLGVDDLDDRLVELVGCY